MSDDKLPVLDYRKPVRRELFVPAITVLDLLIGAMASFTIALGFNAWGHHAIPADCFIMVAGVFAILAIFGPYNTPFF